MKISSFFTLLILLSFIGCEKEAGPPPLNGVNIYIPNIISQNVIHSEKLYPFTSFGFTGPLIVEYFEVYDRAGNLMFNNEQFPPNESEYGWDGRTSSDDPVELGTYTYSIKITDATGAAIFAGEVLIVR